MVKYLGTKLKRLRKKAGLTQEEIANLLGVVPGTISYYENKMIEEGARNKEMIRTFADLYGVSVEYIDPSAVEEEAEEEEYWTCDICTFDLNTRSSCDRCGADKHGD